MYENDDFILSWFTVFKQHKLLKFETIKKKIQNIATCVSECDLTFYSSLGG